MIDVGRALVQENPVWFSFFFYSIHASFPFHRLCWTFYVLLLIAKNRGRERIETAEVRCRFDNIHFLLDATVSSCDKRAQPIDQ